MFDAEIVSMLALLHGENNLIFELQRANLDKEYHDKITFDSYNKQFQEIIKKIQDCSPCTTCRYKQSEEQIRKILYNKKHNGEITNEDNTK